MLPNAIEIKSTTVLLMFEKKKYIMAQFWSVSDLFVTFEGPKNKRTNHENVELLHSFYDNRRKTLKGKYEMTMNW